MTAPQTAPGRDGEGLGPERPTRWQQLLAGIRAAHDEPAVGTKDRSLSYADAAVHRCGGCGGWLYSVRQCKTPGCS